MSIFYYASGDGTWLKGWRNDGTGPAVVLVPGCGTVPTAWPSLNGADCGYTVVTHYQRGVMGSERPQDLDRIKIEDHASDLLALIDHEGLDRVLLAAWSIGVNVAFEFALEHPERVAGILAVAGVPGGTYHTMGAPWHLPKAMRRPAGLAVTHGIRLVSPLANNMLPRLPLNGTVTTAARLLGLVGPTATSDHAIAFARQFFQHDWHWFSRLAFAIDQHARIPVADVTCPVTVVAGLNDVITNAADCVSAASRLPDVRMRVIPGTHFLPLEHPEVMLDEVAALAVRSRTGSRIGPDTIRTGGQQTVTRSRSDARRRAKAAISA